jgi:hypothetical protein
VPEPAPRDTTGDNGGAAVKADPIASRVAQRYRRDVLGATRVEYTDSGTISARDIERLLKPSFGVLMKMRFRPSLVGDPTTVAWEAVDARAHLVRGRLVLHAAVAEDRVVSWAEVLVDAVGATS